MSDPADGTPVAAGMRAITISRQYGSGGGEIAARLAERIAWRLIDHEVVVEVASRLGVTENDAAQRDERAEGFIDQLLYSVRAVDPTPLSFISSYPHPLTAPQALDYAVALRETVLAAVTAGQVVIVGRGAQAILHERRDALHIRVVAPLEQRIIYVSHREALDRDAAQRRIQRKDHDRQRYLWTTHTRRVEDAELYDLILNTAVLDLDSCVDMIALALERKARRLSLPPGALGPSADVQRYPGSPADLPALVAPDMPQEPATPESQPS